MIQPKDERTKRVIFNNCAPFAEFISEINNTQIGSGKYLNVAMQMHNLIEYSNKYSKSSGTLWQYYGDKSNDNLANSELFLFKVKITGDAPDAGNTKDVKIVLA